MDEDMKTDDKNLDINNELANKVCLLAEAPKTASPVPWLTSLHAREGRGNYGDSRYRGNCSGLLIEDLLKFFRPASVLDPMTGSGTCRDVCRALGIECFSYDIQAGFDAAAPEKYIDVPKVDFVWLHPPYWRQVRYGRDARCLAEAETLEDYLSLLGMVFTNCLGRLNPGGTLAVLIGDYKADGLYLGLPFRTLQVAEAQGLWLAAPKIVRSSHGASSSGKAYRSSVIPRLHDICLVLKRTTDLKRTAA